MNTSEKGLNFKFFKDQRILGPLPPQYSVIIEITVKIRKISVIEFVYVFIYVQNLVHLISFDVFWRVLHVLVFAVGGLIFKKLIIS